MRITVVTSLALGIALASWSPPPALGQGGGLPAFGPVMVAVNINYGQIGVTVTRNGVPVVEETLFDGPGELCEVKPVGTPPREKIQLNCTFLLDAPAKPLKKTKFECTQFRGWRPGGPQVFVTTTDTSFTLDGDGNGILRCTTQS